VNRVRVVFAVLVAAGATWSGHVLGAQSSSSIRNFSILAPAVRVEHALAAGETARYAVRASAGDLLRVVVERPGPLTIRVTDAANLPVAERARVEPRDGPETLSWVAAQSGLYRIELRPREPRRPSGTHAVTLAPPRPASGDDVRAAGAERHLERADALRRTGRANALRDALSAYAAAREEWRALDSAAGEAESLLGAGLTHRSLSENAEAMAAYEASLARARQSGDRWLESFALQNMALVYRSWGELERARDHYQDALSVAQISNDRRAHSESASGLARIAYEYGDMATALQLYEESAQLARLVGDPRVEGYAVNGVGNVYYAWGDIDRAVEAWRDALALREAAGDPLGPASSMANIGQALMDSGRPAAALPYFQRALAMVRTLGNRRSEAQSLNRLGQALNHLGDRSGAGSAIAKALELAVAVGDQRLQAELLAASVTIGTPRTGADSAQRLSESLAIWRRLGDPEGEAAAWLDNAGVERSRGRVDAALDSVSQALDLIEGQRRRIPSQAMRASYLGATRRAFELRIDLLMQLDAREPGRGHAGEALHASEQARARSLLDMLAETRGNIRDGVPADVLAREQAARRRLSDAAALAAAPAPREEAAALAAAVDAAVLESERVEAEMRANNPRYRALVQPEPLTLAELQRQVVDDDSLLVEFALGEERSFVWAVGRTEMTAHVLPARRTIEAAARRVRDTVAASHRPGRATAARAAAAELSRLILGPIAARLEQKRLLIVPDGALQFVPFAALPRPGSSGAAPEPLIVRHEIVQLPSASIVPVLRAAAKDRAAPDRLLAVLADPVLAADDARLTGRAARTSARDLPLDLVRSAASTGAATFERLPFTRQEAVAIGALADGAPSLVALDFDASRATALDPALSRYRYLHFASHALLNAQHPELSGIVLSLVSRDGQRQDGFVRLHDIYNMRLAADLVVLSACRTALGRDVRGEGLVGLTRGFMYAGAPRVVASLWDVRDEQTAELMTRFYQFVLKDGLRPAAALRAAQLAMLKNPSRSAPAHWAGFVLQGEWR
jgi:CHAT domain-containing protein/tetratricopeptide (TPR) repeat protein